MNGCHNGWPMIYQYRSRRVSLGKKRKRGRARGEGVSPTIPTTNVTLEEWF